MFQALLPLRGKILNVEKARLDKIYANNEIQSMIQAFGVNISKSDDEVDLEKLRYHKIIIMCFYNCGGILYLCVPAGAFNSSGIRPSRRHACGFGG